LSFFDDLDDEPPRRARTATKRRAGVAPTPSAPRGRGERPARARAPGASGARPRPHRSADERTIRFRRLVLALVVLVVVIATALGVHSCAVSSRNVALRDYANSVSVIIAASDRTSRHLFAQLAHSPSNAQALQEQVAQDYTLAKAQLARAQRLGAPGGMAAAQAKLVLVLQLRSDGLLAIANNVEQALGGAPAHAIAQIAGATARFYASDVLYKAYAAPEMAAALHAAGIAVGAPGGVTLNGGQFLPSLSWLSPDYIAAQLGASLPAAKHTRLAPGTHGHVLNSVSVGGTPLQQSVTSTLPANPPPTFTLSVTNSGQNAESNVTCKVALSSGGPSATATIPETTPGETTTCRVTLPSAPKPGNYTVTAEVEPVPGETNTQNNTLTFPVTFQ
jgi:hypothetical protein